MGNKLNHGQELNWDLSTACQRKEFHNKNKNMNKNKIFKILEFGLESLQLKKVF